MSWYDKSELSEISDDILAGVKVLDLSRDLAGPYASMMLAELGAEVIEVEHRNFGHETRSWPPIVEGMSTYFSTINRSKRSIAVDLKHPEGREIILDLARGADVVAESFTPGVADRLGIGYNDVRALKNDIIYSSISGFGQDGPWRTRRAYDPIMQAMSGHMSLMGEAGRQPVKSMVPIADLSTAIHSCAAILGALFRRERTGCGTHIDVAMLDVMVSMLSVVATRYLHTGVVPERHASENPQRVPSAAFRCSDDRLLQVAPNQRQWPDFCRLLDHPEWVEDPRFATAAARVAHQRELYPMIRAQMVRHSAEDWENLFVEENIACSTINNLAEVFDNKQVRYRNILEWYDTPGGNPFPALRVPFRYSDVSCEIRSRPPLLGEHTVDILREIGRDSSQIESLLDRGVVRASEGLVRKHE